MAVALEVILVSSIIGFDALSVFIVSEATAISCLTIVGSQSVSKDILPACIAINTKR